MEGVHLAVQVIDPAEIPSERPAQLRLVALALRFEQSFGFYGGNLLRREREIRLDHFPHPGAEALQAFGVRLEGRTAGPAFAQLAVQAAGQGMVDHEHLPGEDVANRMLQQEAQ